MARPRSSLEGVLKVFIANNTGLGPERIREGLERLKGAGKLEGAIPSARTIGRMKARFATEDQAPYRLYSWPESHQAGLLPWEAAVTAAECFTTYFDVNDAFERDGYDPPFHPAGPTVRLVTWFYRVTLARPEAPSGQRLMAAEMMDHWEEYGSEVLRQKVMRFINTGQELDWLVEPDSWVEE